MNLSSSNNTIDIIKLDECSFDLKANFPNFNLFTEDTLSLSLEGDGTINNKLKGNVLLSKDPLNKLETRNDGLFVNILIPEYNDFYVKASITDTSSGTLYDKIITEGILKEIVTISGVQKLKLTANGSSTINTIDSLSILFQGDGSILNPITGDIKISTDLNNTLELRSNGLFVPVSNDYKVKISSSDTTTSYLENKLIAGTGLTFVKNNTGLNESITINVDPLAGIVIENGLNLFNGANIRLGGTLITDTTITGNHILNFTNLTNFYSCKTIYDNIIDTTPIGNDIIGSPVLTATINKPSGKFVIHKFATNATVFNSFVTENSIVLPIIDKRVDGLDIRVGMAISSCTTYNGRFEITITEFAEDNHLLIGFVVYN